MKNGYDILWTEEAYSGIQKIFSYLEENWSAKEIQNFALKLEKRLNIISKYPRIFPSTEVRKNIRKSVLTKHIVIYYMFDGEFIKILTVFDSRQNPSKLKV